jgi:hypothetical protein
MPGGETTLADRPARISPIVHDKVLTLSLLPALFRAVFLQRSIERATPHRLGSRGRSIINVFGGSLP